MKPQVLYRIALCSLIGLVVLGLAVELWLAPLHAHGSFLALKIVPLLFVFPGLLRRSVYTMQWSSMLVLLYAGEGLVNAASAHGAAALWGAVEVALSIVYFVSVLAYVSPFKRKAREARALAASSE